jgi:hypothetical protein
MKFSRIMKLKYFSIVLLAVLCMSGCKDDDDNGGDGSPVITVSDVSPAMFGDSITVKVNCKDEGGVPLSTLKAALNYSNEQVQTVPPFAQRPKATILSACSFLSTRTYLTVPLS